MADRRTTLALLSGGLMGVLMCSAPSAVFGQQTRNDSGGGYFGAPVVEYTRLRGQGAVMVGGRGGWYFTPSFVLGGGLYATLTEVDARAGAGANALGPLDVKYEMFGLELEYHVRSGSPTHFTLGTFLGGAAARYARDGTDEQRGETDFHFLVAPRAGIETALARWLRANLFVSFRSSVGVEQAGLRERDLRGPARPRAEAGKVLTEDERARQERIWLHTPIVVDQYALTPEALSGQGMFASLLVYAAALWRVVAWVTHPPRLPMTRGAMARSDGGFA